jgi:segregation and condensation protein B
MTDDVTSPIAEEELPEGIEAAEEGAELEQVAPKPAIVFDHAQLLRLLEAMLFAASEPLTLEAIQARMPKEHAEKASALLDELEQLYSSRGVNLFRVAGKFTLRTAADLVDALKIERTVSRKLSRAALETMAVIAYHQPVTRAEIEEIRGVVISRGTLDILMESGWIQPKGYRETPGRPATWVTTEDFLLHFGLDRLEDLPGVEELKAAGLLDARPAVSAYSEDAGLTFADPPGESEDEDEDSDDNYADDGDDAVKDTVESEDTDDADDDSDDDDDDEYDDDDEDDDDDAEDGDDEKDDGDDNKSDAEKKPG